MSPETLEIRKRNYSEQRSPTLNTVLMVEDTLMKVGEVLTIGKLKRILPKQVMHQTLMAIIDYLEYSGKVVVHDDKVLWAFKPQSKLKTMRGLIVRPKYLHIYGQKQYFQDKVLSCLRYKKILLSIFQPISDSFLSNRNASVYTL